MTEHSNRDDAVRLTEYAELHGCSCKVGQGELDELLADVGLDEDQDGLLFGVGEDASAMRVGKDRALVSSIDFFTPIVDDPYEFGRVAACNATSDVFATGATTDVNALVVLGLPRAVADVAEAILGGFVDAIREVDGVISGGHTILNPWPIAGGAVTGLASTGELFTTQNAAPGDRIYLTKPLGTQPAMGALRVRDGEFADRVREAAPRSVETIGTEALAWMTTPNRAAAEAARGAGATAVTDVTGFGLAGQAAVLAERSSVGVELTRLPVVDGTLSLSRLFGYGLEDGESAETSGGLLATVPEAQAADLEAAFEARDVFYRRIGAVTDGAGVRLAEPTIERIRA